ncbi:TrkA family potassium uptake protein [Actinocorallia lasiicapitis]
MADIGNQPVVVIGLGRFGSSLALELASHGTEVLALDNRPKLVQSLAGRLTHIAVADCTDIEALRELGVPEFYRAVVGIGGDLEASILVTSLLVELEIEDIWAKAVSRQHARILERIGAHHVVLPEHDMGERIAHLVSGRMLDYLEVDKDFAFAKTRPSRDIVGVPLGETNLRNRHGITVVAVKSQGEDFTHATSDTVLQYSDVIVISGKIAKVEHFATRD